MRRRMKSAAAENLEVTDDTAPEDNGASLFGDGEEAPPVSERNEHWAKLAKVAKAFEGFRPASEVLTSVRAVPTVFAGLDHATKVGGLPIERFTLIHGPSGEGKTKLTLGLLLSFLMKDHFACLIDAERTTPFEWVHSYMHINGTRYSNHPFFYAEKPKTYEGTVKYVREFLNRIRKIRDAGKVDEDTSALIVVDSIRKLVPEDLFKRIMASAKLDDEDSKGKSGTGRGTNAKPERVGRDRGAQIKAAMNSAWMDELIPLLEETQAGMVVIARETADPDADSRAKMFGTDFKVGGGKALYYDASLVMRVERQRHVTKEKPKDDEKAKAVVYGERHRVTIRKTKVAGQEDRQTQWYFHDSNGVLIPQGFDRARDTLEMGQRFGLVETKGSWLVWGKSKSTTWQGENNAVKKLAGNPELLARLEQEVRSKFKSVAPVEFDSDGELVED